MKFGLACVKREAAQNRASHTNFKLNLLRFNLLRLAVSSNKPVIGG